MRVLLLGEHFSFTLAVLSFVSIRQKVKSASCCFEKLGAERSTKGLFRRQRLLRLLPNKGGRPALFLGHAIQRHKVRLGVGSWCLGFLGEDRIGSH